MIAHPLPPSILNDTEYLAALAIMTRPEMADPEPLPCPVCFDDDNSYLHLIASGVQQDTVLHLICGDGVHVIRGLPSLGRGSANVVLYQGECGHRFAEVTRFHKGQCFRGISPLGECDEFLPELWRT